MKAAGWYKVMTNGGTKSHFCFPPIKDCFHTLLLHQVSSVLSQLVLIIGLMCGAHTYEGLYGGDS